MNHKHDVNQVLLKFGLLLTRLVGMAPLLKTIFIFEQCSLLLWPLYSHSHLEQLFLFCFCFCFWLRKENTALFFVLFVCLFFVSSRWYAYAWPWSGHLGVMVRGWGAHQKINATRPSSPYIPFWEDFILSLQLTRPKIQNGGDVSLSREKATASPFVATFPATNLLVVSILSTCIISTVSVVIIVRAIISIVISVLLLVL